MVIKIVFLKAHVYREVYMMTIRIVCGMIVTKKHTAMAMRQWVRSSMAAPRSRRCCVARPSDSTVLRTLFCRCRKLTRRLVPTMVTTIGIPYLKETEAPK